MPQLSLIDRYLARSIAVPLIGTLILAAMLLVLDKKPVPAASYCATAAGRGPTRSGRRGGPDPQRPRLH